MEILENKMNFNILITGAKNSGKTSYLQRLSAYNNSSDYVYSETKHSLKLRYMTNYGQVYFHLVEGRINSQKWDGIILMFDRSNPKSFETIKLSYDLYKTSTNKKVVNGKTHVYTNNNIIVLCGNKVDSTDLIVGPETIYEFLEDKSNLMYFDLSVHKNHNLNAPLLFLLETLVTTKGINIEMLKQRADLHQVRISPGKSPDSQS